MNRQYYNRIYLNPAPSPLDMSLLDTREWLSSEEGYARESIGAIARPVPVHAKAGTKARLLDTALPALPISWLKIEARIVAPGGLWRSSLVAELQAGHSVKRSAIRLDNPVGERTGDYAFYMRVPPEFHGGRLQILLGPDLDFNGTLERLQITGLTRP
jgi:hypothetical protein